ncbi:MAG: hypothetical protein QOH31_6887 [Verrucomicrobiota bacterium]|jgi:hypothetical protein
MPYPRRSMVDLILRRPIFAICYLLFVIPFEPKAKMSPRSWKLRLLLALRGESRLLL